MNRELTRAPIIVSDRGRVDEETYNFAFVSADGRLMFFNSKNKVVWSTQLNGIVRMAPKIGELGVIVRQEDNKFSLMIRREVNCFGVFLKEICP